MSLSAHTPSASAPDDPIGWIHAAWAISALAMAGSLFFGEVMKLPPCTLCWYQRICLFPLVAVLTVGIVLRDRSVLAYAAPLLVAGLAISVYHNLLQLGVIDEALSPCTGGVSCSERQIELLGFLTIPMLALGAFLAIGVSLFLHHRSRTGENA